MTLRDTDTNIGLIAGQGELPMLVARGMREAGHRVCCVGLRDQFDPALPELCDGFRTANIVQLGKWMRILRGWEVHQAVMVGGVNKTKMHDPLRLFRQIPDWRAAVIWYRRLRHDRRSPALLAAVADELAANGITLIDSTTFIPDHMATEGVLGRVQPTEQQRADIAFGWPLLREVVELHIGQSMAVRDRDVLTVEAVEGTDAMLDRAGSLCRVKGWTLLKSSSSDHDQRADVPTIGTGTIERMAALGGGCIAIGAGRVILVDRPKVLEAADRAKVAIVGVES